MTDDRKLMANIAPFGLRMQPELKAQVEASAKRANRSVNAEIVARLEQSFALPPLIISEPLRQRIQAGTFARRAHAAHDIVRLLEDMFPEPSQAPSFTVGQIVEALSSHDDLADDLKGLVQRLSKEIADGKLNPDDKAEFAVARPASKK